MSEFYFENQGNSTYLVYHVEEEKELDTLTLGMLANNNISNFAPVIYTQQDQEKYVKYNVTAKISVRQLLTGAVGRKHLTGILTGVVSAIRDAEEYMIDVQSILFDWDRIFVDVSTAAVAMICLPISDSQSVTPDFKKFFKELLFSVSLNPNENNDYFVQIINYLNREAVFSVAEFGQLLDSFSNPVRTSRTENTNRREDPVARPQAPVQPMPVNAGVQPMTQNGMRQPTVPQASVQPMPVNTGAQPMAQYGMGQPTTPQGIPTQRQKTPGMVVPPVRGQKAPGQEMPPVRGQKALGQGVPPVRGQKAPGQGMPAAQTGDGEKSISWFYLMQHYNKENAALYKAQKEQKKQGKTKASKKNKKNQAGAAQQYAIPGAQPMQPMGSAGTGAQPMGSAVPGVQPMGSAIPGAQPMQPTGSAVSGQMLQQSPASNMYAQPMQNSFPQGKANFGETTVLSSGGIGETTVLSAVNIQEAAKNRPYLVRVKNQERIPLDKPVFRIGKEKSYVDYFIGDNTAISRSHANIVTRENGYFVVDTNSTNHTYVNGMMIQSNEEVRLTEGSIVRLANEDFEFHMQA